MATLVIENVPSKITQRFWKKTIYDPDAMHFDVEKKYDKLNSYLQSDEYKNDPERKKQFTTAKDFLADLES